MNRNNFDERELQLRGDIFRGGFFAAAAVLLLNAFLQSMGFVWADGFQQNILMLVLVVTVVTVACHVRGVFFGEGARRILYILVFGLSSIVILFLACFHLAQGGSIADSGTLTDDGFALCLGLLFLLSSLSALAWALRDRRNNPE